MPTTRREPGCNTVLFLCTGNYYRSRFAEVLFNDLAAQRGLYWRAESRGLDIKIGHNVGPLSEHTVRACAARGLPLGEPRMPLSCCAEDLRDSSRVIALKEAEHRQHLARQFPEWEARVSYWQVGDTDQTEPDEALSQIERLVRDLVAELS